MDPSWARKANLTPTAGAADPDSLPRRPAEHPVEHVLQTRVERLEYVRELLTDHRKPEPSGARRDRIAPPVGSAVLAEPEKHALGFREFDPECRREPEHAMV